MMKLIFGIYIAIGLLGGMWLLATGIAEDIRYNFKPPSHRKFGPNYKSLFFWMMVIMAIVPFLNLVYVWLWVISYGYSKKGKHD